MASKSEYSKKVLTDAAVRLLSKKQIEDITVKDLTSEAGVSRSAFYSNFSSIEEIFKEMYHEAHEKAFGEKLQSLEYISSPLYMNDMLEFFDNNTNLILALHRWDIFPHIAKNDTLRIMDCIKTIDDEWVKKYPTYYMCYTSSMIFSVCLMWIVTGKKETKEEILNMLNHFSKANLKDLQEKP